MFNWLIFYKEIKDTLGKCQLCPGLGSLTHIFSSELSKMPTFPKPWFPPEHYLGAWKWIIIEGFTIFFPQQSQSLARSFLASIWIHVRTRDQKSTKTNPGLCQVIQEWAEAALSLLLSLGQRNKASACSSHSLWMPKMGSGPWRTAFPDNSCQVSIAAEQIEVCSQS